MPVSACNGSAVTMMLQLIGLSEDWSHFPEIIGRSATTNTHTSSWSCPLSGCHYIGLEPPLFTVYTLKAEWQIENWEVRDRYVGVWGDRDGPAMLQWPASRTDGPSNICLGVIRQCSVTHRGLGPICVILHAAWISPTVLCHWDLMQKGSKGGFVQI